MTSHNLHPTMAELREAEHRRAAGTTVPPRPPGSLASELWPVVSIVAGIAALLAIAAPSL